jgi:hypothetical protein
MQTGWNVVAKDMGHYHCKTSLMPLRRRKKTVIAAMYG